MTEQFKDYFSGASKDYALYRPHYPPELFAYLASLTRHHEAAWDCATGTGQTAKNLSSLYRAVIATDASQTQIVQAKDVLDSLQNISFEVTQAEHTNILSGSIDLLTVSQALHWFDLDAFSVEANRVLKSGGVLAVWAYDLMTIAPAIDDVMEYLYHTVLDGYWPVERKMIENGYRDIEFSLKEIQPPPFKMQQQWNLSQLLGYLQTWSSIRKQLQTTDGELVTTEFENISTLWGSADKRRTVSWPLVLKVWLKE
jgi:ubiquinone/menaquinone biosynthesis C-methylase UbiE